MNHPEFLINILFSFIVFTSFNFVLLLVFKFLSKEAHTHTNERGEKSFIAFLLRKTGSLCVCKNFSPCVQAQSVGGIERKKN